MKSCNTNSRGLTLRYRGPDHHLWLRGCIYWITYQEPAENPAHKARQRRRSLGTRDLDEARARRDAILAGGPDAEPARIAA